MNEDKKDGRYVFLNKEGRKIFKNLKKKIPNSIGLIREFIDKDIFFITKGEIRIVKCLNVNISDNFKESELSFNETPQSDGNKTIQYKIKDLIVKPKNIYIQIRRNEMFRKSELNVINWLIEKQLRTFVYLKKPVNNLEIGYIQDVKIDIEDLKKKSNKGKNKKSNYLSMKNIFGEAIKIPYNSLEVLAFQHNTAIIQKKSETSMFSKLGYLIVRKFKPEKIFYLNKI